MTPDLPAPRLFFGLLLLLCLGLLGYGYFLQFHDGLEPCPMCIFQRLCYMGVAAVALLATVHGPQRAGVTVYALLAAMFAAIGAAIAARQTWLQHLPEDQVPECGPGLEFMLQAYPLLDVVKTALRGTGECAAVDWTLLGLSIAEWSLVCFTGMVLALLLYPLLRLRHNRQHLPHRET